MNEKSAVRALAALAQVVRLRIGSHPGGSVNPFALRTLAELHIPVDGFRSKERAEFAQPGAPALDFVFTVCDRAAGETCPVWPGQPTTAHWGVADPAASEGSDEQKLKVFGVTAMMLRRRIEPMLALPLDSLDRSVIRRELTEIGSR